MKITGGPNKFLQNYNKINKQNNNQKIGFKSWNSKLIMSGQGLFGLNYMDKNINKNTEEPGNLGDMMSKKVMNDIKADRIAKKIARGESITEEEKAKLMEIAPEKLEKAMKANKRRKELEDRLKTVKTKKEAREIILQAKVEAQTVFEKIDQSFGGYLIEAVNKAEANYYSKNKDGMSQVIEDKEKSKKIDISI